VLHFPSTRLKILLDSNVLINFCFTSKEIQISKMGISQLLLSVLSLSVSTNAMDNADKFYHEREHMGPGMWLFGTEGVYMYTPDGSKQLKHLKNTDICESVMNSKSKKVTQDCGFKTVVSDGHKYVWASNTQGSGRVDAFDIDTGDFVASNPTCGFPWDIDYHPTREEVWVHCWSPKPELGDEGHIDVFNVNAITADAQQVNLHGGDLNVHGHGTVIVDSSLGSFGYGTILDESDLYKIDLDKKMVVKTINMEEASGLYRMVYSPENKHLYIRAYVCCTCGDENSDTGGKCRNPDNLVNVTTGPNAGKTGVPGSCGHTCEATPADTIGLYEYDTVTDTVVTTWTAPDSMSANPFAAPDGSFIAFFANDGGNMVRILEPNANGEASSNVRDVKLGFSTKPEDMGEVGISNIEVIKDSKHNVAIITSTLANFVVLMDLSDYSISKLELTGEEVISSNHGRGAKRSIAWAVGTNYVWVDANAVSHQYIIELHSSGDITKAKVIRTLEELPSRTMLFVQNYAPRQPSTTTVVSKVESDLDIKKNDTIGLSALIIGCVAIVLGIANIVLVMSSKGGTSVNTDKGDGKDMFEDDKIN